MMRPVEETALVRYRPTPALVSFWQYLRERYRTLMRGGLLSLSDGGLLYRLRPEPACLVQLRVGRDLFTDEALSAAAAFSLMIDAGKLPPLDEPVDYTVGAEEIRCDAAHEGVDAETYRRVSDAEHLAHDWNSWPVAHLTHRAVTTIATTVAKTRTAPKDVRVETTAEEMRFTCGDRSCRVRLRHEEWDGDGAASSSLHLPPPPPPPPPPPAPPSKRGAGKSGPRACPEEPTAVCRRGTFPTVSTDLALSAFGRVFRGYKMKDRVTLALSFHPDGEAVMLVLQPDARQEGAPPFGSISLEWLYARSGVPIVLPAAAAAAATSLNKDDDDDVGHDNREPINGPSDDVDMDVDDETAAATTALIEADGESSPSSPPAAKRARLTVSDDSESGVEEDGDISV